MDEEIEEINILGNNITVYQDPNLLFNQKTNLTINKIPYELIV